MISELTLIKKEISAAETESNLQTIKEELNALFKEAPEELKSIAGFGMGPGPGQGQNGNQIPPKGSINGSVNMSEGFPDMPKGANTMNKNAIDGNSGMEKQELPRQAAAEHENLGTEEDNDTDTSTETGFFGKLINSLKALFS